MKEGKENMIHPIKTTDLYTASYLALKTGKLPDFEMQDGKVIFVFQGDQENYEALNLFNENDPVGAFSFANSIKQMRTAMIQKKMAVVNR